MIILGMYWHDIYAIYGPSVIAYGKETELYKSVSGFGSENRLIFSISLFALAIAVIMIIWRTFRALLKNAVSSATECLLLPISLPRDLWFYERVFTNTRLIIRVGMLHKAQHDLMLDNIKKMVIKKDLLGNIFDYGDLSVTDRRNQRYVIRQVKSPERVANDINVYCGRGHDIDPQVIYDASPAENESIAQEIAHNRPSIEG